MNSSALQAETDFCTTPAISDAMHVEIDRTKVVRRMNSRESGEK